jgi:hypothetical protein
VLQPCGVPFNKNANAVRPSACCRVSAVVGLRIVVFHLLGVWKAPASGDAAQSFCDRNRAGHGAALHDYCDQVAGGMRQHLVRGADWLIWLRMQSSHNSGELGTPTVTLKNIVPGNPHDPQAIVTFEIQTSKGRNNLTFSLSDQGSPTKNGAEALRQLDLFLREALDALESLGTT